MCTTKNYLHALDKGILFRLNGFQSGLAAVEFISKDEKGYKYQLIETPRTNAKFDDIAFNIMNCAKKNCACYQVPESEVPRTKLTPDNRIEIKHVFTQIDKYTKEKTYYIWVADKIKDGHLLCIPPSTIQIAAEIAVMEHISGHKGNLSKETQAEVEDFNQYFALPTVIPKALSSLMQTTELNLPSFKVKEIPEKDYVILKDNNRPGNSEQRAFVCNALSTTDFTIKVGPPGSGKTTSVVELIIQLVKRGKRVLLVASTNVAIDNILEKLKEHLDLVCVKRYGNEDSDKISNEAKKFIVEKPFKKTEATALKTRLECIPENVRSTIQQELLENCDTKNNELLYEIIQENAPIVAGTTFGAALAEMRKMHDKGETEPPFDYLILDESSKTTIQEFLVPACLCKHWIVVGDIMQLPPYVSDDDMAENLQICYPDNQDKEREYTVAADTLLAASGNKNHQTVLLVEKESEMDAYLYKKYATENNVLFADADKKEYKDILPYATIIVGSHESFKKNCSMIAPRITTVRLARDKQTCRVLHEDEMQEWVSIARYNREQLFGRFDENKPKEWHDEVAWRLIRMFEQRDNDVNADRSTLARLASELEALIPTGDKEACMKSIRIFEQIYLPSYMELLLRGFGEYKDLALFRGIPQKMLDERLIKLSYQHRSDPEIAQLASEEFYDGKAMRSEHMVGKREWNYHRFKHHNHWENIKGRCDIKNRNKKEQKWIEQELIKFRDFTKVNPKKEGKWTVAVLSFYKEQADELNKSCKKIFAKCEKFVEFSAGSVDSFQGHEADVIFLSYSNQVPTCFIGAPNRLNVAITRARYMMVHVGNWNAMSKGQGAIGRITQKLKPVTHNS